MISTRAALGRLAVFGGSYSVRAATLAGRRPDDRGLEVRGTYQSAFGRFRLCPGQYRKLASWSAKNMMDLKFLGRAELEAMKSAGDRILECYRVLEKTDTNTVAELLVGHGTFYEYDHYPKGDVYDRETHSQYYYHAHRMTLDEHGHFHTFLRRKGMPENIEAASFADDGERPLGDEEVCHFVAISMDAHGYPKGLFTTNRWVTDETWYPVEDVVRMVDLFEIDHTFPNWAVNRWITAMFDLFKPQIIELLRERDVRVAEWLVEHPNRNVYEDRDLEIVTSMAISVEAQIAAVAGALA